MEVQESNLSASQNPVAPNGQPIGQFQGRDVIELPSHPNKNNLFTRFNECLTNLPLKKIGIAIAAIFLTNLAAGLATGDLSKALRTITNK